MAACGLERRGPPTPHGEVEDNLVWPAARRPRDIVGAGRTPPQIPAEARVSPCRRRSTPLGDLRAPRQGAHSDQGRVRRAEVDTHIADAPNPIVRAKMAVSVRRVSRAPTKARCVLKTRRLGRMAIGEPRISQEPFSPFAIRTSPFAPSRLLPSARGWRPSPWRRHTFVWSPLGGESTQAGAKA